MDNEALRAVNAAMAEEFRANGGKIARFTDREILLLTTTGARSGLPRLSPLAYVTDGSPDRLVVFASHLGSQHHPGWYQNLVANPEVTVEVGTETFPARASVATGTEHDRCTSCSPPSSPAPGNTRAAPAASSRWSCCNESRPADVGQLGSIR